MFDPIEKKNQYLSENLKAETVDSNTYQNLNSNLIFQGKKNSFWQTLTVGHVT